MSEMEDIYREVILDHNRAPRNFGKLGNGCTEAVGHNPLCGDRVTVYLTQKDDRVSDIRFDGAGCAICVASCSLMTEALMGKSLEEAKFLFEAFHHMLTKDDPLSEEQQERMGKLLAFSGVREYPVRVKCATLPWHTFIAARKQQKQTSTE